MGSPRCEALEAWSGDRARAVRSSPESGLRGRPAEGRRGLEEFGTESRGNREVNAAELNESLLVKAPLE